MSPFAHYATQLVDVVTVSNDCGNALASLVAYRIQGDGYSGTGFYARQEWSATGDQIGSDHFAGEPGEAIEMWLALTGRRVVEPSVFRSPVDEGVTLRVLYEAVQAVKHTVEVYVPMLEREGA